VLVCANAKGAISAKGQSADCFLHHECLPVFMLIFFPKLRGFRDFTDGGQPLPIAQFDPPATALFKRLP